MASVLLVTTNSSVCVYAYGMCVNIQLNEDMFYFPKEKICATARV